MRILWVALVWPEPTSSAAGSRTVGLLKALLRAGHEVHVCSSCRSNEFQSDLERLGITCTIQPLNDSAVDSFLSTLSPDVVVFDRFMVEEQFGWRVREQCPNALRVLDTVDLHFLRRIRGRSVERGERGVSVEEALSDVSVLHSDDLFRELSAIYRSDFTVVTSDSELRLLHEGFGVPIERLVLVRIEYPKESAEVLAWDLPFEQRRHLIAIGNWLHPPNLDSFHLLRQELWPEIRQALTEKEVRDVELHLYGAYPPKEAHAFDRPQEGLRFYGWTENALSTLGSYRVNLAPLRFGAGIKGKIADGWSVGTPCVTTAIGGEGMSEGLPFGGAIVELDTGFIERVVELYIDEALWLRARAAGKRIIQELYNPHVTSERFLDALSEGVQIRDTLRRRDTFGLMLWHQYCRSTQYFSRWIEAKSRLGAFESRVK